MIALYIVLSVIAAELLSVVGVAIYLWWDSR